jgi:hypothetical protein
VRFFVLVGAWWGVAMLLAISALKSRSILGLLSGLVTVLLFLKMLVVSVVLQLRQLK